MKVASLQALFPEEGETVPKVRFKGFEDEWSVQPLSHFANKSTEKNGILIALFILYIFRVNL
jgi:type I restriction enzyme S subunit